MQYYNPNEVVLTDFISILAIYCNFRTGEHHDKGNILDPECFLDRSIAPFFGNSKSSQESNLVHSLVRILLLKLTIHEYVCVSSVASECCIAVCIEVQFATGDVF